MQTVLIVIQLIVSVALVGSVLLQRSEGGALGMGGGGSGLGGFFSPGLTLLALHGRPESSILDSAPAGQARTFQLPKHTQLPATPQGPSVPSPR